ncbi:hypothetical protein [Sphingorhabdus sp.]|uniref:hypothetical protein n=1 Tax=Sphingorhabdus sp. TaxID=1902408 RepID=UPI003784B397
MTNLMISGALGPMDMGQADIGKAVAYCETAGKAGATRYRHFAPHLVACGEAVAQL